jgi:opacity protein-like surface antigen
MTRRPEGLKAAALAAALALFALTPVAAQAQEIPEHRYELGANAGYSWTFSREVIYNNFGGSVDVKDAAHYGGTLDAYVQHGKAVRLMYQRQDSKLTFQPRGLPKADVADVAIEYFQLGGLAGTPKGTILPYGMFTLGATRLSYSNIDADDNWRFSMILGFGVKKYMGQKLGLQVEGQIPYTWIDASGSVACGSFGCISTVGGTGVGQANVGGGLFLNF